MYNTFISYRRSGGSIFAGRLYDYLTNKEFNAFYDISGMENGRFDEQIRVNIINARNYILVLTPGCLDRCQSEDDWVRKEIALALQYNLNIVLFVEESFKFPQDLPAEIRQIKNYQAVYFNEVNIATRFELLTPMLNKDKEEFETFDPFAGRRKLKIGGTYITKYEDDDNGRVIVCKCEAKLHRFFNRVYGTSIFGTEKWKLNGRIFNKQRIAGTYRTQSDLNTGIGTFFLEIKTPSLFEGYWSGYDHNLKKVTTGKYVFKKKYNNFAIRQTTKDDLPRIAHISDLQLGEKYVTVEELTRIIDPETSVDCVSVIDKENGKVVAFCVYDIVSKEEFFRLARKEITDFQFVDKVGYLCTIACNPKYNGLGVADMLIKHVMKIFEKQGVTHVFSSAWKHAGKTNIEHLLLRNGFIKSHEIPDYWYQESVDEGYMCPQCGNPCHCSCVFFIKI